MKTVLVSGATGFLGSHLVKTFLANGYNVIALKRKGSNLHKIEQYMDSIIIYDIESYNSINNIF